MGSRWLTNQAGMRSRCHRNRALAAVTVIVVSRLRPTSWSAVSAMDRTNAIIRPAIITAAPSRLPVLRYPSTKSRRSPGVRIPGTIRASPANTTKAIPARLPVCRPTTVRNRPGGRGLRTRSGPGAIMIVGPLSSWANSCDVSVLRPLRGSMTSHERPMRPAITTA